MLPPSDSHLIAPLLRTAADKILGGWGVGGSGYRLFTLSGLMQGNAGEAGILFRAPLEKSRLLHRLAFRLLKTSPNGNSTSLCRCGPEGRPKSFPFHCEVASVSSSSSVGTGEGGGCRVWVRGSVSQWSDCNEILHDVERMGIILWWSEKVGEKVFGFFSCVHRHLGVMGIYNFFLYLFTCARGS